MKYNFDELIPRTGTLSYKWDSAPQADILPLWVADMDFRTAPAIIDALQRRPCNGASRTAFSATRMCLPNTMKPSSTGSGAATGGRLSVTG